MNVATCPGCGGAFEMDVRLSGQLIECPHCRLPMQMPYAQPIVNVPQQIASPVEQSQGAAPLAPLAKAAIHRQRKTTSAAAVGVVLIWSGWALGAIVGVYAGLWILRGIAPDAFTSISGLMPFLKPLVDRLPN